MNKKWIIILSVFLLAACSSKEATPKQKGKGPGKGAMRTINVEGYLAVPRSPSTSYKLAANLLPWEQVEIKAETSGKLIQLKVKDGVSVNKGTLIAKINDAELQAQLKQAESTLLLAKQKEKRTKTLFEKEGATQADLEIVVAGTVSAEASVALIRAQIAKTEIRAPFSGTLGILNVSPGEWMTAGASIATLSNTKKLKVSFILPQRYASNLPKGAKIKVDDTERGVSIEGIVRTLAPILSQSNRSRVIQAEIDNREGLFLAGAFAEVNVPIEGTEKFVIHIPAEAVTLDDTGPYVFVTKSGKAEQRYIKTGLRTPISVSVYEGLAEGDTVIVSGMMSVREGITVKIKELRTPMNYEVRK